MKVKIWIPQEIEVEEDWLTTLQDHVNGRFDMLPTAPVHMEDMLNQAVIDDLLPPLPDDFRVDDEWSDPLTDADIADLIRLG